MKAAQIFRASTLSVALLAASVAAAHHSSAGLDRDKAVTLTGAISKVEWMNPHVLIHLQVKDEQGKMEDWKLGWAGVTGAIRAGVTQDMLKNGSKVTIEAYRFRESAVAAPASAVGTKTGEAGCLHLEGAQYRAGYGPPCAESPGK